MASSQFYTATFIDIAVAAGQDFLSVQPAANRPIEICYVSLFQTSDFGDAQAENLAVSLVRGHTTAPSGGVAVTPTLIGDSNAATSGVTARRNDTTIASGGSVVTAYDMSFNVAAGLERWFPEDFRLRVQNAVWVNLRLRTAPADSLTMSGTIGWRNL